MKKLLLLFFILFQFNISISQVTFCPTGAEWHYLFSEGFSPWSLVNEKISRYKDSTIGNATYKMLYHSHAYSFNGDVQGFFTFIKQKGYTVFFKNSTTANNWEILYNFSCSVGNSWTNSITNYSTISTFTTIVDSIKQMNINGQNLKVFIVTMQSPDHSYHKSKIIEGIGNTHFLFDFEAIPYHTDGPWSLDILCYKDNSLGLKQFTNLDCNFSDIVSIDENKFSSNFKLFPNPCTTRFSISNPQNNFTSLKIYDAMGKQVHNQKFTADENVIDVGALSKGLYL
jgi:hypothetical protein